VPETPKKRKATETDENISDRDNDLDEEEANHASKKAKKTEEQAGMIYVCNIIDKFVRRKEVKEEETEEAEGRRSQEEQKGQRIKEEEEGEGTAVT
jgi:hypothetical protein